MGTRIPTHLPNSSEESPLRMLEDPSVLCNTREDENSLPRQTGLLKAAPCEEILTEQLLDVVSILLELLSPWIANLPSCCSGPQYVELTAKYCFFDTISASTKLLDKVAETSFPPVFECKTLLLSCRNLILQHCLSTSVGIL